MATACLFIGFDHPVPGREAEAFSVLTEDSVVQLEAWQREGWFERLESAALTPHSGTLNMLLLLMGERAKLDELRRTDGFERFSMRLARLWRGYGVIPGVTGEGLTRVKARQADLTK